MRNESLNPADMEHFRQTIKDFLATLSTDAIGLSSLMRFSHLTAHGSYSGTLRTHRGVVASRRNTASCLVGLGRLAI
jgi:flagellar biosynthesis regulator FlbT